VRGLVCNWSQIKTIDWSDYDIITFNEVWGIKEYEALKVDEFEIKAVKLRENARGGGTIIFGRKSFNTKLLNTPFVEGTIETTGITVGNTCIVSIYRPPGGSKEEFVVALANMLDNLRGRNIILMGDFNINFLVNNNILENVCNLYNLKAKIKSVTRIASGSCIDNFITNIDGVFSVSNICVADHQAIKADIIVEEFKIKKHTYSYREMKELNWLKFKGEVHNLTTKGATPDIKWTELSKDIKLIVEKCFPLKERTDKYTFYMSAGLKKSRDKKNEMLKKLKAGKLSRELYVAYNKIYRRLVQAEKDSELKSKLARAGNNGKKKWKAIKETFLLEKEQEIITEININNRIITDDMELAQVFKSHFETCATKLTDGLPEGSDTSSVMTKGTDWKFKLTSELELIKIIKSLTPKNSSGPDLLSNRMLKKEMYAFSRLLKPMINDCISNGIFPTVLKEANIIPVYKKGPKACLDNYRPISLLPVLSKVFEKVLNAQITQVIDNGFIDDNQFGFRKGHSTEDAVIKFVDEIERELGKKNHVASVFIDVSKAFDSCDHQILMKKIERTGLDNTGLSLMANYLKDRKQIVIVKGKNGGSFVINIGVGQGTILGPTLFKIYIMDLHLHTKLFTVKFADDSSFVASARNRDELENLANQELVKIGKWFKDNKLVLHPGKSRYLIHSKDKLIQLKLNGSNIQRSGYGLQEESVKLLGIEIDENIDWKCHIASVKKKVSKGNYLLWRHGRKMSPAIAKIMYESFVRCHLLYCLNAWGGVKPSIRKPLDQILKRIWSKIGNKRMHTLNRLQKYEILNMDDEIEIQEQKLIHKWEYKKLPKGVSNIILEKITNLRGRKFVVARNWKNNSIAHRLAKQANQSIKDIMENKIRKKFITTQREKIFGNKYAFLCNRRNCYICTH
jgi:hypothetical protein